MRLIENKKKMIKGFLFSRKFKLHELDFPEALEELDPRKMEGFPTVLEGSEGRVIKKSTYSGNNYNITLFTLTGNDGREEYSGFVSIKVIYGIFKNSMPDLLNSWILDNNTVLVATPKFEDLDEDEVYERLLDEVTRIIGFFISDGKDLGEVTDIIKRYGNLVIKYRENGN